MSTRMVTYGNRLLLLRLTAADTRRNWRTEIIGLVRWTGLEATGQLFETLGFLPGRRQALMRPCGDRGGVLWRSVNHADWAAVICSVMLVASTMHIRKGLLAQNGGYGTPLCLCRSVKFAFTGPGSLSLDALLESFSAILGIAALLAVSLVGYFHLQRHSTGQQTTSADTVYGSTGPPGPAESFQGPPSSNARDAGSRTRVFAGRVKDTPLGYGTPDRTPRQGSGRPPRAEGLRPKLSSSCSGLRAAMITLLTAAAQHPRERHTAG